MLVAIDADTVLAEAAIPLLVRHFGDPRIGAVAGSAVVGNPVTLMTRFQALEYMSSQNPSAPSSCSMPSASFRAPLERGAETR